MIPLSLWTLLQETPAVAPLRALAIPMLVIAGLVLMSAVLYDAMTPKRVKNDPRDRPVPNLLVGSAALWALGAVAVWFFPFVRESRGVQIVPPPAYGQAPGAAVVAPGGTVDGDDPAVAVAQVMNANGCGACHAIDGMAGMTGAVGPALTHAATEAQKQLDSGYTGEATDVVSYLHEAIVNPNAYVVPDYQPIMPATFGQSMTPEDIDLVVQYLATLQ